MVESGNTRIERMADLLVIATAAVMTADPLHADPPDKDQVLELFEALMRKEGLSMG